METRQVKCCPKCKTDKPLCTVYWYYSKFRNTYSSYCKSCSSSYFSKQRLNDPRQTLLKSIRKSARKRGLDFNLTIEDIIIPEFCPALDIPLIKTKGIATDNTPSVDRIDSNKGYIKGNVQVLSLRANMLKSNASIDELEKILNFLKRTADGPPPRC